MQYTNLAAWKTHGSIIFDMVEDSASYSCSISESLGKLTTENDPWKLYTRCLIFKDVKSGLSELLWIEYFVDNFLRKRKWQAKWKQSESLDQLVIQVRGWLFLWFCKHSRNFQLSKASYSIIAYTLSIILTAIKHMIIYVIKYSSKLCLVKF